MKNFDLKRCTVAVRYLFLTTLLFGGISAAAQDLIHPGGWHTQADLDLIRTKVAAGEDPWTGGWNAIEDDYADENYTASVSALITGKSDLSNQGHAAYVLAIKWVATGEQKYATAAINIIDAWVNTVEDFDVYGPTLTLSTASGHMAQAAEILAHGFDGEAGWAAESIANAQTWLKEVIYPFTSTGGMRSMNWGTSCVGGNMSLAIFCDDQTMFDDACDAYRFGFTDTDDGYCGVTQYIVNEDGQCYESGRDQTHTQGGIAHLLENALCAWNQGVNLVSYSNYRLLAGVEYTAKYNLGYEVSWSSDTPHPAGLSYHWPDGISEEGRGEWSPVYYMSAKLFTLAGVPHPYTEEVIASAGYSPEFSNSSHPGMGDLCFIIENGITQKIEAESHIDQNGTQLETCSDTGGGTNVAYISDGDWCQYPEVVLGEGGSIQVRVARPRNKPDSTIEVWIDSLTGTKIATIDVPETGGWQAYETVTVDCPTVAGQHPIFLKFVESGTPTGGSFCNVNWFSLVLDPVEIEAEAFSAQSGVELEPCSDVGGGTNVANINPNDWCRYDDLFIASDAVFSARVARPSGLPDGIIEIRADDPAGTLLGSVAVSETGDWQTYETIRVPLNVDPGTYSIYLVFVEDVTTTGRYLFNFNRFSITPSSRVNPPETLIAEAVTAGQIDVSWNNAPDATAYNVKRANASNGAYSSVAAGIPGTSHSDHTVLAGTNYTYIVTALYGSAESGPSIVVGAVPSDPIGAGDVIIGGGTILTNGMGGHLFAVSVDASGLGYDYQVLQSDSLTDPDWKPVTDVRSGNGGNLQFDLPVSDSNGFYRLEAWRK